MSGLNCETFVHDMQCTVRSSFDVIFAVSYDTFEKLFWNLFTKNGWLQLYKITTEIGRKLKSRCKYVYKLYTETIFMIPMAQFLPLLPTESVIQNRVGKAFSRTLTLLQWEIEAAQTHGKSRQQIPNSLRHDSRFVIMRTVMIWIVTGKTIGERIRHCCKDLLFRSTSFTIKHNLMVIGTVKEKGRCRKPFPSEQVLLGGPQITHSLTL